MHLVEAATDGVTCRIERWSDEDQTLYNDGRMWKKQTVSQSRSAANLFIYVQWNRT